MALINRENCINSINFALSALATYIKEQAKYNLTSPNIVSESFYAIFFNAWYDCELQNLNLFAPNAKAIDLIDVKRKIIVQVTSNNRKKKLKDTLKGCDIPKYEGYHFKMVVIARSGNSMKSAKIDPLKYIKFNQENDVVDLELIQKEVALSNASIDKLTTINEIVTKNIGVILRPIETSSHLQLVIEKLAQQEMESEYDANYKMGFDVEEKIQFNNLLERKAHISDTASYEGMLRNAFKDYDRFAKNKSQYVVRLVRRIQQLAPAEYDGVRLYDYIIKNLLEKMIDVSGETVPHDELEFYADLLVVYAFVNCKIFSYPVLNYDFA